MSYCRQRVPHFMIVFAVSVGVVFCCLACCFSLGFLILSAQAADPAAGMYRELLPGDPAQAAQRVEQARKEGRVLKMQAENPLASLAGQWACSLGLQRKGDGLPVFLEGNFDAQGQGSATLKTGDSEVTARAKATLTAAKTLRVETEEYRAAGERYYPVFLECAAKPGEELICKLNNGWTWTEQGYLLAQGQPAASEPPKSVDELLTGLGDKPEPQDQPAAPEDPNLSARLTADALAALTPPPEESKPAPRKPAPGSRLTLPKNSSDISFLEGRWRCTDLVRSTDLQPIVTEFSFDRNGRGTVVIIERSGERFTASARATYRDGVLRIDRSRAYSGRRSRYYYGACTYTCMNRGDSALCSGTHEDGRQFRKDVPFIRLN